MTLKWGIISTGRIANDFVSALKIFSEDEHQVVAVAARSQERADEFAKKFNIPRAYGSYVELVKDEEVDIVYIGVINPEHLPVTEIVIEHGKNVLCEKPLGVNYNEAAKMINLAKAKNVFLMEGMWSRFNPIYEKLRQELNAGTVGNIRQIIAHFGTESKSENIKRRITCGGGLLDRGIYALQLITMVFGNVEPTDIQAVGALNEDGVDEYASVILKFGEKGVANLCYSISNKFENMALIYGTKGSIKIDAPFHAPTKMWINDVPIEIQLPQGSYKFNFPNSEGFTFEADSVKKCLDKGLCECPLVPLSESLLWRKISDKIRRELGVKFDQDS